MTGRRSFFKQLFTGLVGIAAAPTIFIPRLEPVTWKVPAAVLPPPLNGRPIITTTGALDRYDWLNPKTGLWEVRWRRTSTAPPTNSAQFVWGKDVEWEDVIDYGSLDS